MASRQSVAAAEAQPGVLDRLAVAGAPWLAAARSQLRRAWTAGRHPHALLLSGPAGVGQSALALWAAQLALCERDAGRPCGSCASCVLFLAGNHPDFRRVTLEPDATAIKVDQVRDLSAALALRSYRGGYQVGIIDPADALNTNAFNALLKTLEEPSEKTILILVASRAVRLPATIVSRCQRLVIPAPRLDEACAWLDAEARRDDWPTLLALAGGGPLEALALANSGAADLGPALAQDLAPLGSRTFDPWRVAELWHTDRPAERLRWLERWVAEWLREAVAPSDGVNNNRAFGLPRYRPGMNIGAVFACLDRLRDARAALEGPLNVQLLLEDVLVGLGEAFAAQGSSTE